MNKILISAIALLSSVALSGQSAKDCHTEWKTQCGTPTNQERFPLANYSELPQHAKPDSSAWSKVNGTKLTWGNIDTRYSKTEIPEATAGKNLKIKGWRGEKVMAQAVIWTSETIEHLNYEISSLKNSKGAVIDRNNLEIGFVRYVMTDEANPEGSGNCGERPDHTLFDSTMVADCIDPHLKEMRLQKMNSQAVWIGCKIPRNITPGTYRGKFHIKDGDKLIGSLNLEITAGDRILPEPNDWRFHLDLWQNPFAVARYYQVPLWSTEHLDAMRPVMKRLADAGQKVITASIMHKPWNGQTEDYFESMVTWIKKVDGSWDFQFDVFDRWVEFMMSIGIDRQINCYSMVPWRLSFQYFDQASNSLQFIETAPGEPEYEEMWSSMLTAFAKHLKEKGWFDICTIAMDERPMEVMKKTLAVIRKADPDFKISLAGNYHPEIEKDMYDYCITINENFPEEVLARRKMENKVTTLYTCCSERYPNTFTFSPAAEAAWIGCYMAAAGVDGYLRWAYNSWTLEPLLDSRFRTWAGGDTYIVYPGDRSSIRFERLIEGIQIYEKIRILKDEFTKSGNTKALSGIEEVLASLKLSELQSRPAGTDVRMIKELICRF